MNETDPVVDDKTFMENVRDAIENGYDRCCSHCGVGVYDASDIHERRCFEFEEPWPARNAPGAEETA